jgi:hypothetical protein
LFRKQSTLQPVAVAQAAHTEIEKQNYSIKQTAANK